MSTKQFKTLRVAGALILAGLVSGQVMAVPTSDTASAEATATIIAPISITNESGLRFGQVARPNSTQTKTIIIKTDDQRDAASTSDAVGTQVVGAASFTITAAANLAYTAEVSYEEDIATGATLSNVQAKCGAGLDTPILLAGGTNVSCEAAQDETTNTLKIGGTLTLTDQVAEGEMQKVAAITVTVAYD